MIESQFIIIQQILALVTLILGGALIIFIYDAYKLIRQPSLLFFTLGMFILVIGIVVPDIAVIAKVSVEMLYWGEVFSRILAIIGIGVMNYAVLRG
ncbi:hypothetical protein AZH53_03005 [Methanomicrobiaceae archaeon CYW5]|uniref:hypothetical protein n=1 Tax=Methanovulcanius yangii TaxID=1789227 RepID=UPI0029CA36F1|nr:hypothetical protein [Methanovulcanius yangii]MBT8507399.1 hypothetical protein [Methanovulcanius yangii]